MTLATARQTIANTTAFNAVLEQLPRQVDRRRARLFIAEAVIEQLHRNGYELHKHEEPWVDDAFIRVDDRNYMQHVYANVMLRGGRIGAMQDVPLPWLGDGHREAVARHMARAALHDAEDELTRSILAAIHKAEEVDA